MYIKNDLKRSKCLKFLKSLFSRSKYLPVCLRIFMFIERPKCHVLWLCRHNAWSPASQVNMAEQKQESHVREKYNCCCAIRRLVVIMRTQSEEQYTICRLTWFFFQQCPVDFAELVSARVFMSSSFQSISLEDWFYSWSVWLYQGY